MHADDGVTRLERVAAGVEGDALSDERDAALDGSLAPIGEVDKPRGLVRAATNRQDESEPFQFEFVVALDDGLKTIASSNLLGLLAQPGWRAFSGVLIGEVTGEDARGPGRLELDCAVPLPMLA